MELSLTFLISKVKYTIVNNIYRGLVLIQLQLIFTIWFSETDELLLYIISTIYLCFRVLASGDRAMASMQQKIAVFKEQNLQ